MAQEFKSLAQIQQDIIDGASTSNNGKLFAPKFEADFTVSSVPQRGLGTITLNGPITSAGFILAHEGHPGAIDGRKLNKIDAEGIPLTKGSGLYLMPDVDQIQPNLPTAADPLSDFTTGWTDSAVTTTDNSTTGPDKLAGNASIVRETGTTALHYLSSDISSHTRTATRNYTYRAAVEIVGAGRYFYIRCTDSTDQYAVFDLSGLGTVGYTANLGTGGFARIRRLSSTWYWCEVTWTQITTQVGPAALIYLGSTNQLNSIPATFLGDIIKGFNVYGGQMLVSPAGGWGRPTEVDVYSNGAMAESYVDIDGANFFDEAYLDEWTIVFDINIPNIDALVTTWQSIFQLDKDDNDFFIQSQVSGSTITLRAYDAVTTVTANTIIGVGTHQIALVKNTSNITFYINGIAQTSTLPLQSTVGLNQIIKGRFGGQYSNFYLRSLRVYEFALTALELNSIRGF